MNTVLLSFSRSLLPVPMLRNTVRPPTVSAAVLLIAVPLTVAFTTTPLLELGVPLA
jgi:hypothetical protein